MIAKASVSFLQAVLREARPVRPPLSIHVLDLDMRLGLKLQIALHGIWAVVVV